MNSIKTHGLSGKLGKKNWSDSKDVVYLSTTKEEVESYAETAEEVPEEYLNQIIILQINRKNLDPKLLRRDRNVIEGTTTYEYHGVIKKFKQL